MRTKSISNWKLVLELQKLLTKIKVSRSTLLQTNVGCIKKSLPDSPVLLHQGNIKESRSCFKWNFSDPYSEHQVVPRANFESVGGGVYLALALDC